jgi:alkylation response protein AidB-like acyl-CoA dehydrogenase
VNMSAVVQHSPAEAISLDAALAQIAACATDLDLYPRFPTENMLSLQAAGITQLAGDREHASLTAEIALVRALAGVDASTARILDGHFNGVERLAMCASEQLRQQELDAVLDGRLLVGVWGADPSPGEGPPAKIERDSDGALVLRGVKTFCSGAGGVQRALVLASDEHGARRVAYVDCSRGVQIDRDWYRASGLRSSESHLVCFKDTPVLALLGGENELLREPYFSRDAVRTAATWAGIADCILRATVCELKNRKPDELQLHAVGHMRVALGTIDRWLTYAAQQLEQPTDQVDCSSANEYSPVREPDPATLAGECRVAIAAGARQIASQATRACGSRALAGGGTLDRARRDLDLFLLQHRLDLKIVSLGRRTVQPAPR